MPNYLRAGGTVVRHFAHKANTSCTGETILHRTAKRLLVQVVAEYSRSSAANPISLSCTCSLCQSPTSITLPRKSFTTACEEHRLGHFICDVVAFRNSEPVLGIEVLVTHAVDDRKAESLSIPWFELSAEMILENPYQWRPISARLKPVICLGCKAHVGKLHNLSKRWSQPFHEPARACDPNRDNYLAAVDVNDGEICEPRFFL
jgi:hypothetical protein